MNTFGKIIRRGSILAMALVASHVCPPRLEANPTGGTVAQGTATFNSSGSQLTIQTSDLTHINWQSFNIGAGETTTFVQPSSSSVVWNQINDVNPSQILGNLNANGYVILQNPSGFYIGGQASITTHGLMMTTAPISMPSLSSGGVWQFNTPPPTAKIINYGQINIAGGGSAYLIANDIENNGTISAPGGKIGLYAGEQVLVSTSPDGRGLSAQVTLPEGSVDNQGRLIADGGNIALQARVVNQGGIIQANSARNVNGTIELLASDAVNLGAGSVITAQGDSQGTSSGGTVTIKSDNAFSDAAGSTINISGGAQGGNGGHLEISAASLDGFQSRIEGHAAGGFRGGELTIDPANLTLDDSYVNSLNSMIDGGLSQINLQADYNIEVSAFWTTPDSQNPGATLTLQAGRNITLDDGSAILAGANWNVNMIAGTELTSAANRTAGLDGIYLNGSACIQAENGNINLTAGNEIMVDDGIASGLSVDGNGIRTVGITDADGNVITPGGNITVKATYGDVNTGGNKNGYLYGADAPPYDGSVMYAPNSADLGGISTAAGGDVTITAGGNITSYVPVGNQNSQQSPILDGGSGAFGSQPGNVTITAGGNVYGHYVLANGVGTITAGGNIGIPATTNPGKSKGYFALSLINGGWSVYAPNGSIYVQDVRNPNGVFNSKGNAINNPGYHYFDYDPLASLFLDAGNSVEFTGSQAPRTTGSIVPFVLPPTLQVIAGAGGFILDTSITLFPSPYGDLNITTLNGGNFTGVPNSLNPVSLAMSDSGSQRWNASFNSFLANSPNHAAMPTELNNPDPVVISISGSVNNVNIYTTKKTQMTVAGDMNNSSFLGENLHAGDVTFVHVAGNIYNTPLYSFVPLPSDIVSANPLQPGAWDSVFLLAVNPDKLAALQSLDAANPSVIGPSGLAYYLQQNNDLLFGGNPGFVYDPASLQLGFKGIMSSLSLSQLNALEGKTTLTVLVANSNGTPYVDQTGHLQFMTYNFSSAAAIANLYQASLSDRSATLAKPLGLQIGGPGQFDISAASMELGNSAGILSWGFGNAGSANGVNYASLQGITGGAASGGAAVNVDVEGNLSMLTSAIASLDGGNVTVNTGGEIDLSRGTFIFRTSDCYGIYTSGHSDVNVVAGGDINIGSSRIAAFNGGNVFVESLNGDVNAGNGANIALIVFGVFLSPSTGLPIFNQIGETTDVGSLKAHPAPYGSGIIAMLPTLEYQTPGGNTQPGDILVETPHGNISSTLGGISQFALGGDVGGNPTVTLIAGTPASDDFPAFPGNIDLGQGGVVGGTVTVKADTIKGLIVSRQNANIDASQSFAGTVLSSGTANFTGGGSVSGTVVGIGGINVSGGGSVSATLLSQNVSVGGATESTLGTTASATSTSQAAAQQSGSEAKQQLANDDTTDEDAKKKKKPALQHIKRVTVILPKAS